MGRNYKGVGAGGAASCCCFLLALALGAGTAVGEPVVTELEEFSTIRTCLPFNLLIKPSDDPAEYSLSIDSDQAIVDAVAAEVNSSVLVLSTTGGFNVSQPIKVWVTLPKDKLEKVVKSAASDVVVHDGFTSKKLDLLVNGLGRFIVKDIEVDELLIDNTEIGYVLVDGQIKNARIAADKTSVVYLQGVVSSVEVELKGVAKVHVVGASRKLQLSGRAKGLSRVMYTQGRCAVRGDIAFRRSCRLSRFEFPATDPTYSCGLLVDGALACSVEAAASTSYLSSGTTDSSAFSASGSSFGNVFTSASTSSSSRKTGSRSSSRAFTRGSVDTLISTRTFSSSSSSSSSFSGSSSSTSSISSSSSSSSDGSPPTAIAKTTGDDEDTSAIAVVSGTCDVGDKDLKMLV